MENFLRGEVVGRTIVNRDGREFIVDTCFTNDTRLYETAIMYGYHTGIVEMYPDIPNAQEGHKKWCDFTLTEPVSTVLFTILDD